MRNILIGIVILAVGGFLFTSWKIKRDVAESVDMAVMMMSPYAIVQYEDLSATLTGELTVNGVRARVKGFKDEFYIDRIGIDTPSFLSLMKLRDVQEMAMSGDDILPEYFGVFAEGFRVSVDSDYNHKRHESRLAQLNVNGDLSTADDCTGKYGLSPANLIAMGYDDFDLSMAAHFRQRNGDYAIEISSSGTDMWNLDAELVMAGDMLTEMAMGSRYRPKMSEMRIEYTDLSMQDRMVDYCRRRGLSDDEIHTAMLDAFEYFGRVNGIEFDEYVMEPFTQFIDGGKTFVVTAKPNEPVSLSQITLYSPKDVPALLQLSAEAH